MVSQLCIMNYKYAQAEKYNGQIEGNHKLLLVSRKQNAKNPEVFTLR